MNKNFNFNLSDTVLQLVRDAELLHQLVHLLRVRKEVPQGVEGRHHVQQDVHHQRGHGDAIDGAVLRQQHNVHEEKIEAAVARSLIWFKLFIARKRERISDLLTCL